MAARTPTRAQDRVRTYSHRRGRVILLVCASLVMTAVCVTIAIFDDVVIFNMLGMFGAVFFGASVISTLRSLIGTGTVVELGPHGVHDRRVTADPIPWTAFRQGQALEMASSPTVVLDLTDDNKHLVQKPWWHGVLSGTFRSSKQGKLTVGLFSLDTDSLQFVRDIVDMSGGRIVLRK